MNEENHESIRDLYAKIEMLSTRVKRLEELIVEEFNTEEVDWAELAQQQRDNEEGWIDR